MAASLFHKRSFGATFFCYITLTAYRSARKTPRQRFRNQIGKRALPVMAMLFSFLGDMDMIVIRSDPVI